LTRKADRILHVLFDGPDDLARRMIKGHEATGADLKVIDLSEKELDARALVDEIFRAHKVFSWHA
jgi:N-methylhydantoinase A/oxoprolinase/acetone carboxylase beta subunit